MANPNNPFGFRIARHRGGGCVQHADFTIASGLATNIFTGDPIKMTGTGKNVTIALGDSVDAAGIFLGCAYTEDEGSHRFRRYWPSGTVGAEGEVQAVSDSNISFFIQTDALVEANIGKLCDWNDGAGNAKYGTSGRILLASEASPAGAAVRIVGLADLPGNEYGDHAIAEIVFAKHNMMV